MTLKSKQGRLAEEYLEAPREVLEAASRKANDTSMVDRAFPLKSFSSLIETTSNKAATSAGQEEAAYEDHDPEAMSSQDQELSPKYSSSLSFQTTPFSVSDILSPFDDAYRQHYARNLDSSAHYMGPTR